MWTARWLRVAVLTCACRYNQGGWIALHLFERGSVLTDQMRAPNEHGRFLRRVRWAYTRDDNDVPFERVNDYRANVKRGLGENAGRYTKAATEMRDKMLVRDARMLRGLTLSRRSEAVLRLHDFASAPVVSPRNEPRNAIIEQRVKEWGRVHGQRVMRWRAVDKVRAHKNRENDKTVREMYEAHGVGRGDAAVRQLRNYYGRNDTDDKDARQPAKIPADFWYAPGLPMVLNHNRATHCGWTNGATGRAGNLVLDEREPPDDGTSDFRELQYLVIACHIFSSCMYVHPCACAVCAVSVVHAHRLSSADLSGIRTGQHDAGSRHGRVSRVDVRSTVFDWRVSIDTRAFSSISSVNTVRCLSLRPRVE